MNLNLNHAQTFDVIVVGGGHAGTEAALASARMGASTLLLTQNIETLGQLSCNPSIGGIGKSHLVKEIDALGGIMAIAADRAGIQWRILNGSKGPAVRATRAQVDRQLYKQTIRETLENQENLLIFQQTVIDLLIKNDQAIGVMTQLGFPFYGKSIVLTAGTFLDGRIHVGLNNSSGGRAGDASAHSLATRLRQLPFRIKRLKTGTPPRLDGRTIDTQQLQAQPSEYPLPTLSNRRYYSDTLSDESQPILDASLDSLRRSMASKIKACSQHGRAPDEKRSDLEGREHVRRVQHRSPSLTTSLGARRSSDRPRQVSCFITHTNETTHQIIRENLDRSPLYSGRIEGIGPRYCPSIEDKVVRFADKTSHQIFLEPEGLHTHEVYPNGISTSLPFEVQSALVHSIKGLEHAHLTRPGYAIEYDFFDPRDLYPSLESRIMAQLFCAGQINGTTGYEEAAAQGLLAGANAALKAQGKSTWSPKENEAYLGVLIQDLITQGTLEPYRMFTSRAKYRLLLREDNADLRLTEIGYSLGLIDKIHWEHFSQKKQALQKEQERLSKLWIHPNTPLSATISESLSQPLTREITVAHLLARPECSYAKLMDLPELGPGISNPELQAQIDIQAHYQGYITREQAAIEKQTRHENTQIPNTMDYQTITGLSTEVREKLMSHKPLTIGHAARIPGVTPAAISILLVYVKRHSHSLRAEA